MRKSIQSACYALLASSILTSTVAIESANAEIAIVTHPSVTTDAITAEQASKIFLGKISTLPDGTKAIPIDQAEGNSAREEFYGKVANKTASQLNAYWSRLIFTGKGQPPKAVEDDDEVLELVAENPNLIGYINAGSVDETVKVILSVP